MAGHSHFANIMHKKARVDVKRGKAFSKISRLIMAAVKTNAGEPWIYPGTLRLLR